MSPAPSQVDHSSAVTALQHGSEEERTKALEHIIAAHWKVLYKYLRLRPDLSSTDAETITRNFLGQLQEKGSFDRFDSSNFPIRFFLKERLDQFAASQASTNPITSSLPIDFALVEEEFRSEERDPSQSAEEYFESEWMRNLFTIAVEELYSRLQSEEKTLHFSLFLRYDLQNRGSASQVSMEELARELTVPADVAKTYLNETRKRYQEIVKDLVRSFTTSDAEFRKEVRLLFEDNPSSS